MGKTVYKPVQRISKATEKVILVLRIDRPHCSTMRQPCRPRSATKKAEIQKGITNAGEDSVQPESGVRKSQKPQSLKAIRGVCHIGHPFPQDVSLDSHDEAR